MPWPFEKTVVGIISNSDYRVPRILESQSLKVSKRRADGNSPITDFSLGDDLDSVDDIDFVVLSYDVGHEKPDRQIFDAATKLLAEGLKGNEKGLTVDDFDKLYVGDDIIKDYDAAKEAGWDALLLDRHSVPKGGLYGKVGGFWFGDVEVSDKGGKVRKVTMAKTLFALQEWRASRQCLSISSKANNSFRLPLDVRTRTP
jgi:hypothetical protein